MKLETCFNLGIHFINSLAPGRFKWNFRLVIFKLILVIGGWGISCAIVFRWMSLDLSDGKSTLVQVMAWCRQATSHYLSQCWPRSMSPYGVTRPQWVNRNSHHKDKMVLQQSHISDENTQLNLLAKWSLRHITSKTILIMIIWQPHDHLISIDKTVSWLSHLQHEHS